ncbi:MULTISPECIES: hypothetical protein [Pseudomonas]|uniref:hypothetical protein n=1 Tax=Pseudomonas TaxID=286 RepID=UPI003002424E
MSFEMKFEQQGTFQALYAAQAWLKGKGYSYSSTSRDSTVGIIARPDVCIAKWHNLTPTERAQCDGTLTGDFREGPLTLRLKVAPE